MRFVIAPFALLAVGCSNDFDRWNSAACAGDRTKFWDMVDENAVMDDVAERMEEEGTLKGDLAEVAAKASRADVRQDWDAEVKKGTDGVLCAMKADGKMSDSGAITVTRKSGKKARLRFKDGKLVSFRAD